MTGLSLVDYRKWAQGLITKPSFMSQKAGSARYDIHSLAFQEAYYMLLTASGLISNKCLTTKELDQIEYDMILSGNRLGDILKSKELIEIWIWIWSAIGYWLSEAIEYEFYETAANIRHIVNKLYENNDDKNE